MNKKQPFYKNIFAEMNLLKNDVTTPEAYHHQKHLFLTYHWVTQKNLEITH